MKSLATKLLSFGLLPVLCAMAFSGCDKVTFPKEKVISSVVNMCQQEYNVKVKARIVGSNLGVHIDFASLFGDNFDFKEAAMETLEDVLTSIRRIVLSTDSNFEFYTVVGSDQNNGVELVMTRNLMDLKLVMYGNIGRADYSQRMMLKVRPDVNLLGERKLRKFFADMATGKIERIIGGNFAQGTTLKDISSTFFLSLLELGMKQDVVFKILSTKFTPISADEGLFYAKVKETYVPKVGYETNTFSFPSGYDYEYLFLVNCKDFIPGIKKIIPLNGPDSVRNGPIKFPEEFARYANLSHWEDDNFFLEEVSMPEFLSHQIAQRIRAKINADSAIKDVLKIESVDGNYTTTKRKGLSGAEISPSKHQDFELVLKFKKKGALQTERMKTVPKELVNISLDVVKEVCKNYKFENFSKVKLLGSDNEELFSVDRGLMKTSP